jgi:hypothetical protein
VQALNKNTQTEKFDAETDAIYVGEQIWISLLHSCFRYSAATASRMFGVGPGLRRDELTVTICIFERRCVERSSFRSRLHCASCS